MSYTQQSLVDFSWVQTPLIANAPMSGVATSELAAAVTRAGGLGLIGFINDPGMLDAQLRRANRLLEDIKATSQVTDLVPVGVGIIVLGLQASSFMPLLARHKPAVVWLSFGETTEFKSWTDSIRRTLPHTKVWVQVGSVSAALQTAQACHPDALVLQGSDAGGHGHARGSSIVTLVPEVADTLNEIGLKNISLVAAGGIMDGRGVAAAMALGAAGVVMGTRFLGAEEAKVPGHYRREILSAFDGGESTVRSRIFDEMWCPSPWPDIYDGRCLRNACYEDLQRGVNVEEIRSRLYLQLDRSRSEEVSFKDTSSLWAGTGVGLVKKIERAGNIVEASRDTARKLLCIQ